MFAKMRAKTKKLKFKNEKSRSMHIENELNPGCTDAL
jgi:hypothetical protein